MRVLLLVAMALLTVACSAGADSSPLRRSSDTKGSASNGTKTTQRDDAPSTDDPPATNSGGGSTSTGTGAPTSTPSAPAPTPAPTTTSTPTPPAPAGACGNPKCVAFFGTGGCKATDTNGTTVVLGCDQGACTCITGNQQTSAFAGSVASPDDAKALFLANCDCL